MFTIVKWDYFNNILPGYDYVPSTEREVSQREMTEAGWIDYFNENEESL